MGYAQRLPLARDGRARRRMELVARRRAGVCHTWTAVVMKSKAGLGDDEAKMTRRRCCPGSAARRGHSASAARGWLRQHALLITGLCRWEPNPCPSPVAATWADRKHGCPAAEACFAKGTSPRRAAASSCAIWPGPGARYCAGRSSVSRRGCETQRKMKKKIGCNHPAPIQANFV